jgi:hypothetical protein
LQKLKENQNLKLEHIQDALFAVELALFTEILVFVEYALEKWQTRDYSLVLKKQVGKGCHNDE